MPYHESIICKSCGGVIEDHESTNRILKRLLKRKFTILNDIVDKSVRDGSILDCDIVDTYLKELPKLLSDIAESQ